MQRIIRGVLASVVVVASVAACGGGSSSIGPLEAASSVAGPSAAGPLGLEGATLDGALAGDPWAYRAVVTGSGTADVSFRVENKPAWASFDAGSGALSGTPGSGDVGEYKAIRIVASAGGAEASVTFDLRVVAVATGRATLVWQAPASRTNGTGLADLAGYRVYYGKSPRALDRRLALANPSLTSAEVSGLTPGKWYFVATAYDRGGSESALSEAGTKTIG